jgi:CelD/BcsL family acetyltransferase involved in cellulose biosynthesis
MDSSELRVETVSDADGLLGLRNDWDRLVKQDPGRNSHSTFEWVHAWWFDFALKSAGRLHKTLNIVVVRQDDHVVAIAPLVIHTAHRGKLKIRKVEFAGAAFADYQDFILEVKAPGLVSAIVRHLVSNSDAWDLVELRHIREDSITPSFLDQAIRSNGLPFRVRLERQCFFVHIESDWRTYLRSRSRRTRKTFRNHMNRLRALESEGLQVRIVDSPHTEPDLLARMIELEQRKRIRGAPTLYMFQGTEQFYQRLIEMFGPPGQLYVAVMEKGQRLIAYELGFCNGLTLLANAKAYDVAFKRYSPGTMLLPAIFDFGFQSGFREYDFGRGDEEYKKLLAKDSRRTVRYEIWNTALKSRFSANLYFKLRPYIYQLRARVGLGYVPRWEL